MCMIIIIIDRYKLLLSDILFKFCIFCFQLYIYLYKYVKTNPKYFLLTNGLTHLPVLSSHCALSFIIKIESCLKQMAAARLFKVKKRFFVILMKFIVKNYI